MSLLCSRLAPCGHTRVVMAALARCMPSATAALHVTPRKAFGSSSSGGGAAAAPAARPSSSGGRSAHVCQSYTDPEVYSIAFNFRKFDVEVRGAWNWDVWTPMTTAARACAAVPDHCHCRCTAGCSPAGHAPEALQRRAAALPRGRMRASAGGCASCFCRTVAALHLPNQTRHAPCC